MSNSRFSFQHKYNTPKQKVLNSHIRHETSPSLQLKASRQEMNSVIFVEEQKAIICACGDDSSIRVYDQNSDGNPKAVFDNHSAFIQGLAQLDNDLTVSVSYNDYLLLTWRVSDTHQIGNWVHTEAPTAVAKLDVSHSVVGDFIGGVFLLYHNNGTSLQLKKKRPKNHSDWIKRIVVYGSIFVTCSWDKTAIVWDAKSFEPLTTLYHKDKVYAVAINDKYIITSSKDYKLHVFENAPNYNPSQVLHLAEIAYDVQFLDDDLIALVCTNGFLDFISLSQKSYISRCKITDTYLESFVIFPNAQILVGGYEGFCSVFTPPEPVLSAVQACVSRLYPFSQTALQHRFPLRAAWESVQAGSLTLYNACATIITSDNCKHSIDEWCIAHNLLMQAVKTGDIPPSRHFNDIKCHWHLVLYHHCSKLAIGQKDIAYLVSLFNQAEDAGVIATGGAEVLIDIISVRKDIIQDTRLITNAIYKLFLRQAHTDVRLQQILHYQKVQQLTSLINAIVGCISVAGGIATNVLSGGASILNDFQVCGLADSLIGVGNDFASFGYEHLVDRFVSRSTQILSPEEWQELSSEQRKVVEDAALNLGLTVDELRERLQQFVTMDQSCSESPATEVVIEEIVPSGAGGNESISPLLLHVNNETTATETQARAVSAASSSVEVLQENLVSELRILEDAGVEKNKIREMNSLEIATALSAVLVLYMASNAKRYVEIRDVLVDKFCSKSITGRTFVHPSDSMKKGITKVVLNAISAAVVDEDDVEFLSIHLDEFLDRLS